MKSIKTKIIVNFSILILLISGCFAFVSLTTTGDVVTEEAEKSLVLLAQEGAKLTESRIETQMKTLEILAGIGDIETMDLEQQQPVLQRQLERTDFLALGVVYPDGTTYYHDGTTAELGDREYVKKAFNGEANVSDLIVSRVTNQVVLMYAAPIENDGEVVGVLIGRNDGNALSDIADDMNFGEMGHAYMINANGNIVADSNRERVLDQWNPIEEVQNDEALKSIAEMFRTMMEDKTGVSSYYFEGQDLYAGYVPIEGSNWIIAIAADKEEVLAAIPRLQRSIAFTALIILIISIIICYVISKGIADPIIELSLIIERLSKYDLRFDENSKAIKYFDKKDEIGTITRALGTMQKNLIALVKDIADTSQQVASSSEELTATSQQSAMAADEVAKTIEEIAKGASDQAKDTENGVENINGLGELIEKDQENIKNLNTSTNEVAKLKDEGLVILKDLVEKTETSNKSAKEIHEVIVNTNTSAEKIENASAMIRNIAEQTNLLALNAAIEAARAGDAGRGFAVVAEEIRKLAEQSNTFTEEIATIIKELTDKTGYAVNTIQDMAKIVASQTKSVELTNDKFKGIDHAIEKVKEMIMAINQSGQEMEGKKNEIIEIIQNLSAISQENAAGTEEASASVEEQTASMEEIANASDSLARLAEEMQESISKFKY